MKKIDDKSMIGVVALLIHAAKIDENYSENEKTIILNFIKTFFKKNENVEDVLQKAEKLETDSNQLLTFTNIIKNETEDFKSQVIEQLWGIIISDKSIDHYESNLMRRICGLIYFSDKLSGEIKLRVMNQKK
tara:strand:- start:7 stop:402 length:396 start_codon:yes stop_codon:yes gene_type:complete